VGPPAAASQGALFVAGGPLIGGVATPPSESGYNPGLKALEESTSRTVSRLSQGEQARIIDEALMATVRRLEGCLGYLPADQRRVLVLRAGIGAQRVLTAGGVARQLHVTLRRVYRLEKLALRRLLRTARTQKCAAAAESSPEPTLMSGVGPLLDEEPPAAGGVEGARYTKSPSPEAAGGPANRSLGGISEPTGAGVALLAFFAAVGGVLLVGLLFLDGLTAWPTQGDRRSSWMHHHPWNWHK
jgi:hypothetical protein